MKISKLMIALENIQDAEGDIEVAVHVATREPKFLSGIALQTRDSYVIGKFVEMTGVPLCDVCGKHPVHRDGVCVDCSH